MTINNLKRKLKTILKIDEALANRDLKMNLDDMVVEVLDKHTDMLKNIIDYLDEKEKIDSNRQIQQYNAKIDERNRS